LLFIKVMNAPLSDPSFVSSDIDSYNPVSSSSFINGNSEGESEVGRLQTYP